MNFHANAPDSQAGPETDPPLQERWLQVGELRIRFLESGRETGAQPALVLLHGHGESADTWHQVLPALARTRRVIAPDLPGAGASTKPAAYAIAPAFYQDFLSGFLDALGLERVALIGSSHGGLIALRTALAQPQRVSALGLVGSAGLGRYALPALVGLTLPGSGEAAVAWWSTPPGAAQWVTLFASLAFADPLRVPSAWYANLYRLARTPGHLQGAVLACLRGQLGLEGQREVLLDRLPSLEMPVLILWGREDRILPAWQGEQAARHLRNGRLAVLPQCGHLPHVERPQRFLDICSRFLAGDDDSGDSAQPPAHGPA